MTQPTRSLRNLLQLRLPRRALVTLGLAACATPAYALRVEPDWLRVRRIGVPSGGIRGGKGIRWAHFTDVHFKGDHGRLDRMVDCINDLAPDFACFTGDLIEEAVHLEEALAGIRRIRCPVYGVPGNHDHWAEIDFDPCRHAFAATGGAWLMDEPADGAGGIRILGLDHAQSPLRPDPSRYNLVLMHYPEWARELPWRGDLLLAGHTHGGQVRLPGIGPLVTPQGTGGYDLGWFETPSGPLYVNPGIGTFHLDVRFNCRPEVTLFEAGGPGKAMPGD